MVIARDFVAIDRQGFRMYYETDGLGESI